MKSGISFLFVALFSLSVFASFETDFDALKNSGKNFEVIGTICEQVAQLELQREYKEPQYTVVTGIAYADNKRTIGELDVVIFQNNTNDAIQIYEVKCWKDMAGGLKKAKQQRSRFLQTVKAVSALNYQTTDDHRQYSPHQFTSVKTFQSIAQKGSKEAGFEIELEHSLEDLMKMRTMIMDCQSQGECKSAR